MKPVRNELADGARFVGLGSNVALVHVLAVLSPLLRHRLHPIHCVRGHPNTLKLVPPRLFTGRGPLWMYLRTPALPKSDMSPLSHLTQLAEMPRRGRCRESVFILAASRTRATCGGALRWRFAVERSRLLSTASVPCKQRRHRAISAPSSTSSSQSERVPDALTREVAQARTPEPRPCRFPMPSTRTGPQRQRSSMVSEQPRASEPGMRPSKLTLPSEWTTP